MWKSKKEKEPIIVNPKDWSKEEFNTICKVLNLAPDKTKMIVLRENLYCEYDMQEEA
ncbi:MAG: hypothetical protein E7K14_01910 [Bacillota bacterium]|jgi:hypothetical protein|uniref:hypothetical protein n=1 Tax=Enterocloster aldenensis TaxID=358742 RepID=UPI00140CEE46|nr:hypothetical protein [Bacillota bacterium]